MTADTATRRFLVRKRTTFTWLVPLGLMAATVVWGRWNRVEFVAGFIFLILGEIVRFWAAGYIQKDDVVATGGPYALVRNPLYFGSLLLAVGFSLISGIGPVAWIIVIVLFAVFHLAAIASEEQFLKRKFGDPYERYLHRVPRLIPMPRFPGRGQEAAVGAGSFSIKQAFRNREQTTAAVTFATALVFWIIFECIARYGRPAL